MSERLEQIKERAARMKAVGIYDTQAAIDREYLLEVMALMDTTMEVMTMEDAE